MVIIIWTGFQPVFSSKDNNYASVECESLLADFPSKQGEEVDL
jgi:hypothetical protein